MVRILPVSDRAGETPQEVERELDFLLKKYPDAEVKVGGSFIVVIVRERTEPLKIETAEKSYGL